ncbi:hypothetical protein, partial [Mycobacterium sherrisii]|uniref:hypothetical protein n=1 Tax=Mycobacterium sherrisii TaxID=243061 RepID=UPI0021F334A8
LPHEGRPTPEGDHSTNLRITTRGGDFYMATSEDFDLAIDSSHVDDSYKIPVIPHDIDLTLLKDIETTKDDTSWPAAAEHSAVSTVT